MRSKKRAKRRSGGSNPRKRPITAAQARQLAAKHVLNRMFAGAVVKNGATVRFGGYGAQQGDTWVIYKNQDVNELRSSDVVVVCKRTGRILYEGIVGDEG